MPETTITNTAVKETKATFTPPVLNYCPVCGKKLAPVTLTNAVGDTISGMKCTCNFIWKPEYRKASPE